MSFKKFGWGGEFDSVDSKVAAERRGMDQIAASGVNRLRRRQAKQVVDPHLLGLVKTIQEKNGIEGGFDYSYLYQALFGERPVWVPQSIGSCFVAGTPVRMADGTEKPIEQIKTGDKVIGGSGKSREVTNTFRSDYTGTLHTIRAMGSYRKVTSTHCHKFGSVEFKGRYSQRTADLDKLGWTKAEDISSSTRLLRGFRVDENTSPAKLDLAQLCPTLIPVQSIKDKEAWQYANKDAAELQLRKYIEKNGAGVLENMTTKGSTLSSSIPRYLDNNESLHRLLGLYLAEGGTDYCRVTWTFSYQERNTYVAETFQLIKDIFGLTAEVVDEPEDNRSSVRLNSKTVCEVFKALVPGNVYSKRVPSVTHQSTLENQKAFILGWLDGDGCYGDGSVVGVSVSENLVLDIRYLLSGWDVYCNIEKRKARKQSKEAYNLCISQNEFQRWLGNRDSAHFPSRIHKAGIVAKVRSVETKQAPEGTEVFCIEVEEDHSFLAAGLVVHNCVASGAMRAIAYRSMAECFLLGSDEELLGTEGAGRNCYAPFAPYHYRAGRHFAGINGYQDGSLCLPQVQGLMEFGILRCDTEGLQSNKFPEPDDDQLYKRWGASDELLDQFKNEGQRHLLLESEPVNDADSAEVLLTEHFKPLNMCSSWAFKAARQHPTWKDDRGVPVMIYTRDRGDTWHHNVSITGCVMVNSRIFFIVLNQWGAAHHQREWFVVTGEEMQDWLNDSGTVCQSVGDIGLNSHGNDIFGEG